MKALWTLHAYFLKYRVLLLAGIGCILLSNLFRIVTPSLTGWIVDRALNLSVMSRQDSTTYGFFLNPVLSCWYSLFPEKSSFAAIGLLFICALISGFFMFLMRQTIIVMSRKIEFDQKNQIYQHYQTLDFEFYKRTPVGDLMNRISEDVSRVRMYTGPALMYFINLAAVIVMSIWFMWTTDTVLTLVALSPMPLLALTIYWLNARINKKSERVQQSLSTLTSIAQESFSGIRVIKSYSQESAVADVFRQKTEQYKNESLDVAKTEAFYFPSMALLIGLSTLLIILVGGWQVTNHMPGASVGKITSFILYVQLLTFPVSAIGWTVSMVQRAAVSQRRILEFLNYKPALTNSHSGFVFRFEQGITFSEVGFTYKNTGIQALSAINWSILKGQRIAIVGRTGSGKSTLLQLVLRFIDPDVGTICIDNQPLTQGQIHSWRSQIGYVPQDSLLFSETIRDNIRMGNPKADEQTVIWAAKMAGIHDEIDRFSEKYDTLVGERGVTLSGGQKQRISLARALVRKPAILILDDVFSALDAIKEEDISLAFNESFRDTTILYSTGRHIKSLRTDYILCLANGQPAECGTHDELMKKQGVYASIMLENNRNSTF